jgi:beta-glucanase (GH16 family)
VVELDALEAYGFSGVYNVGTHLWRAKPELGESSPVEPTTATGYSQANPKGGDLSWEFHDYGIDVTDSHYVFYCDGREVKRFAAFPASGPPDELFVLLNLALGGGWPVPTPPGKRHDLWVDYVRVYSA